MKAIHAITAMISFLYISSIIGCPTCIWRLKRNDEPFFSDSFYQSRQLTESHEALKAIDIDEYEITDDIDDEGEAQ